RVAGDLAGLLRALPLAVRLPQQDGLARRDEHARLLVREHHRAARGDRVAEAFLSQAMEQPAAARGDAARASRSGKRHAGKEGSMTIIVASIALFLFSSLVNITLITVFYHRAIAHHALVIPAGVRRALAVIGPWCTGLDVKGWVCMHRMHHRWSDTAKD